MASPDTSSRRLVELVSFVAAAALVVVFALRGGGGYDLVTRQEAAVVVWAVIGVGVAIGVLPRGRWKGSGIVLLGALAALAGWTALAFLWTSSAERTTVELARVLFFLGIALAALSLVDRHNRGAVLGGLFAGAVIVVGLALLSRLFPGPFPVDHLSRFVGSARRLNYPFGYWNALGCLGAMVVVAGVSASAGIRWLPARCAALAGATVAVPTIYLTYSRGAIIATAVALVVGVAVSRSRWVLAIHAVAVAIAGGVAILVVRGHDGIAEGTGVQGRWVLLLVVVLGAVACAAVALLTRRLRLDRRLRLPRRTAQVVLGAGVAIAIGLLAVFGPGLADRAWDSFSDRTLTVASADPAARLTTLSGERREIWQSALDAFDAQPLRGIGPGTFEFWWDRDPDYTHYARDAHSLYIETLAELGIVGLLLVLATVGSAFAGLVVASRRSTLSRSESAAVTGAAAAFAAWATFAFYDWMWESTAVTALALAATATGLARSRRRASQTVPLAARIAIPVGCLVALVLQLPALSATSQVRGSQQAAARGDLMVALARANDAIAVEPWAASPYLQRALVEELGGAFAAAAGDARRAAERQRTDYRPWLVLSRIEAKRGRPKAAIAAYRRAIAAKPSLQRGPSE